MNPSLAVIFLTLFSGAGFGLMAMVAIVNDFAIDGGLSPLRTAILVALALLLVTIGMVSSTAHLANPKNAWRAFTRWRTSWLAREGVFAVLFYPLAIAYLGWVFFTNSDQNDGALVLGNVAGLIGLATIFCQGMIYACLRTIRQWHTPLVPANFYALGLALGMTILATSRVLTHGPDLILVSAACALLVAAGVMKAIYYFWIGAPSGTTLQTATGFTGGRVKLLDQGHTFGTFLTHEFSNCISPTRARNFKIAVYVLGIFAPMAILLAAAHMTLGLGVLLAPLLAFIGIGLERYLFFVEAQHVVNLYHGRMPGSLPQMHPALRGGAVSPSVVGKPRLVPSYEKR
ncbi:dimethyl sulfoxide reductase anchor subunit family protein [Acidiferrobacter thiooxydans]|jgi:DMSO reductase anchor subunit|uniref:Dimethyl sulfoxide reductase n=1 Tax=Acidiferrobacter thiooxydans TaxID=163359 RepID=A0A1C2G1N5_9GAMM|nr:DmsC/YnfH family molybdoenzyme membrane anchor subunit [Acidiferrobacter thiooxydans]RCN56269.1 dimethyl sulfoxide reductase [Acidiferrobacter thiooxydans]UEN98441.1 dimethyl sulfoxide reductase anchor subunit [Acidiferrobacter thiooxydans]